MRKSLLLVLLDRHALQSTHQGIQLQDVQNIHMGPLTDAMISKARSMRDGMVAYMIRFRDAEDPGFVGHSLCFHEYMFDKFQLRPSPTHRD